MRTEEQASRRLPTNDDPSVPLVEMSGIDKSFPGVRALSDAQFSLFAGEVHALMGENGAGKSTLMKILSGIYQRDAGEIRVDGKPVEIAGPREAQKLGICLLYTSPSPRDS